MDGKNFHLFLTTVLINNGIFTPYEIKDYFTEYNRYNKQ